MRAGSIVAHCVQDSMRVVLLVSFQDAVHFGIDVLRARDLAVRAITRALSVEDGLSGSDCFLVIVLDLDVDDMHWAIELSASIEQILAHCVEASFLARNDDICGELGLLPSLGCSFDVLVPVEHGHQSIRPVQPWIFAVEIVDDVGIRCSERIDIGQVDLWAGQTHGRTGAGRRHVEARLGQQRVGRHGAVLVRRTYDAEHDRTVRDRAGNNAVHTCSIDRVTDRRCRGGGTRSEVSIQLVAKRVRCAGRLPVCDGAGESDDGGVARMLGHADHHTEAATRAVAMSRSTCD
ncbi:hypothetical protein L1887_51716 [Cichorium endivia]|nr:hypothetical protein L1887_51716 [Cichorium endivia]